jgi:hypothetical protein
MRIQHETTSQTRVSLLTDVYEQAQERLFFMAIVMGVTTVLLILLRHIALANGWEPYPELVTKMDIGTAIVGVFMFTIAAVLRKSDLKAGQLWFAAASVEILAVLLISVVDKMMFNMGQARIPMSPAGIILVAAPALLPMPPRWRIGTTILTVLAVPFGNLLGASLSTRLRTGDSVFLPSLPPICRRWWACLSGTSSAGSAAN